MKIPETFNCAGFQIKVEFVERTYNNSYGNFCDVTNTIQLAKIVSTDHLGDITLTQSQIESTFLHELIHVFQFYYADEYDETQAQAYSNFLREFFQTIDLPF